MDELVSYTHITGKTAIGWTYTAETESPHTMKIYKINSEWLQSD